MCCTQETWQTVNRQKGFRPKRRGAKRTSVGDRSIGWSFAKTIGRNEAPFSNNSRF